MITGAVIAVAGTAAVAFGLMFVAVKLSRANTRPPPAPKIETLRRFKPKARRKPAPIVRRVAGQTLKDQTYFYFRSKPDQEITATTVSRSIGAKRQSVYQFLSVLTREGLITRVRPGVYQLAKGGAE